MEVSRRDSSIVLAMPSVPPLPRTRGLVRKCSRTEFPWCSIVLEFCWPYYLEISVLSWLFILHTEMGTWLYNGNYIDRSLFSRGLSGSCKKIASNGSLQRVHLFKKHPHNIWKKKINVTLIQLVKYFMPINPRSTTCLNWKKKKKILLRENLP